MHEDQLHQFRKAAADLKSVHSRIPAVEEVAEYLGLSVAECRAVVKECHLHSGASWRELGVIGRPLSCERMELRDLQQLFTTPRAKAFVISKILEQHRLRYLSSAETRLLVFAIVSGEHRFETLDTNYSKLTGSPTKYISFTLHDRRLTRAAKPSFFERLEQEISYKAERAVDSRSREYAYREFLGNAIRLFRDVAKEHLFSTIIRSDTNRSEAAQVIAPFVNEILQSRVEQSLIISTNHIALLRALIASKGSGVFTTMAKFAEAQEVDVSGIHAALRGRGKYLGVFSKMSEMNSRYGLLKDPELEPSLDMLFKKVSKARTLSTEETGLLIELLDKCEQIQLGITENQTRCLYTLLNDAILGATRTMKEIGQELWLAEDSVTQLLRDRDGRPGAMRWLDEKLTQLSEPITQKLADLLYPYSVNFAHGIIQRLSELPPLQPPHSRLYLTALTALDSFAQQLQPIPIVRVKIPEGKIHYSRPLNPRELGRVLIAYINEAKGDLKKLQANFSAFIESRENPVLTPKVAWRMKHGRTAENQVTPGAVTKLKKIAVKYRDVLHHLQKDTSQELLNPSFSEFSSDRSVSETPFRYALKIAASTSIAEVVSLTGTFCATRPHSAREIVRVAQRLASSHSEQKVIEILSELQLSLQNSSATFDSQEFCLLLVETLRQNQIAQDAEAQLLTVSLASSCIQRGVTSQVASQFLSQLHMSNDQTFSKVILEIWGTLGSPASHKHSKPISRFLRSSFVRFVERSFIPSLPAETVKKLRYQYQELVHALAQLESSRALNSEYTRQLLHDFYSRYSIPKIIQRYCHHHLQSPLRPQGLPFDDLYDIAIQAVLEATTKYNPEKYIQEGHPPPTFSTFAVNMIRWTISRQSQIHQKDRKKIAFSLNDELKSEGDGDTFLSIIADAPQQESSDQLEEIDGISPDKIIPLLNDLRPLSRRIIQLRFYLGEGITTNELRSAREIAKILHTEELTPQLISSEGIRQALLQSFKDLRAVLWRQSLPSWVDFFRAPDEIQHPTPLMLPVTQQHAEITPDIRFNFGGTCTTRLVALSIDKVIEGVGSECEVLVKAMEPKNLEQIALFIVSLKNNKVQACERVDA